MMKITKLNMEDSTPGTPPTPTPTPTQPTK